jgi:WD40 repeat protein
MVSAVTTTMWRRSVLSERRAEAQKLIALGQVQLEGYPTAALAHAEASLELVDTGEARRLALESLWRGPTAFVVNDRPSIDAAFSADSNWLVQGHEGSSSITVLSREGTQTYLEVAAHSGKTRAWTSFQGDNDLFITFGMANDRGRPSLWSASEERMIVAARPVEQAHVCGPNQSAIVRGDLEARAVVAIGKDDLVVVDALDSDGSRKHLGDVRMTLTVPEGARYCMPQRSGGWLALDESGEISVVEVSEHGLSERRYLGHRNGGRPWRACRFDPDGRFFLTVPASGEIEVWDPTGVKLPRKLVAPPRTAVQFSADGSHLFGTVSPTERGEEGEVLIWRVDGPDFRLLRRIQNVQVRGGSSLDSDGRWFAMRGPLPDNRLWSLEAAAAAEPIAIRRGPAGYVQGVTISPDGRWLATNHTLGLTMWPLVRSQPAVIRVDLVHRVSGLDFDPEGRFLVFSADDTVTVVPLQQPVPPPGGVAFKVGGLSHCLAVSPDGERFAIGGDTGGLWVGANDGRDPVLVGDPSEWRAAYAGTFDPEGHYLAFMTGFYDRSTAVVRVWNLESDTEQATLQLPGAEFRYGVSFSSDGRLLAATTQGVVAWDVESGQLEILVEEGVAAFTANRIGRRLLFIKEPEAGMLQDAVGTPVFVDLDSGLSTPLTTHGSEVWAMALDRDGSIAVTGDRNGIIRVGRVTGEEPHILVGHEGEISHIAIDPLGRWIASAGEDDTVRLWPMPDLSKPPLHTLPRDELIAKLKSLTNLRVVRDEESSTGWKVEVGPFPGWETVPTW